MRSLERPVARPRAFGAVAADITVVTEDRTDRADKTSIHSACGLLNISSITVRAFLRSLGIWPKKSS